MKLWNLFENEDHLKSIKDVKRFLPQIIQKAQKVYDDWDENEDEYGGGGICHLIADDISFELNQAGIDASTVSATIGEQHVWVVFAVKEGVYNLDIPPYCYEKGGGYSWQKLPNVKFDASHITIDRLSPNPEDFENFIGE